MILSIIVAMDRERGIGKDGRLPWRLSADLRNFKRLTMGHSLILGRKTWESIGRPLPGRRMIVVTRQADYEASDGVAVVRSLQEALAIARENGDSEVFIGGGAGLYHEALPAADRIYLTRVAAHVEADTHFPQLEESNWSAKRLDEHEADERNEFAFRIEQLDRLPG